MTNLPDDVVERCAMSMALREWPSDNPEDPITWPGDFSDRERQAYRILARAALEAARYGELRTACDHLLACIDMCDEAGAPPDELDQEDVELIDETSALLSTIGEPNPDSGGV